MPWISFLYHSQSGGIKQVKNFREFQPCPSLPCKATPMKCFITVLTLKSALSRNVKRVDLPKNWRSSLPCAISLVKDNIPQALRSVSEWTVGNHCGFWMISSKGARIRSQYFRWWQCQIWVPVTAKHSNAY